MMRLLDILQESNGNFSSARFQMLWFSVLVGIGWFVVSLHDMRLVEVPESVLWLVLGAGALKVIQKPMEKGTPNDTPKV